MKRVLGPFALTCIGIGAIIGTGIFALAGTAAAGAFFLALGTFGFVRSAVFGGSAEYVALWFKSAGAESMFFWYVTVMCAIALIAAIAMPDPRRLGR